MKKVATEIPENEFKELLEQLKEEVLMMKNDGLGYVSITCALAKKLTLSAAFKLVEADGGLWKKEAMNRIKHYLEYELSVEIEKHNITIIA